MVVSLVLYAAFITPKIGRKFCSFIYSFSRYLLNTCYVSCSALAPENPKSEQSIESPCPHELHILIHDVRWDQ